MRIALIIIGFVLAVQLKAQAPQYRNLSWEEKMSDQYKVNLSKSTPTAKTPNPAARKEQQLQAQLRQQLAQSDAQAQQEASQARWEREEYTQLHQQQRRLETQIAFYQKNWPTQTATIQKYQTALAQTKQRKAKTLPYWTK